MNNYYFFFIQTTTSRSNIRLFFLFLFFFSFPHAQIYKNDSHGSCFKLDDRVNAMGNIFVNDIDESLKLCTQLHGQILLPITHPVLGITQALIQDPAHFMWSVHMIKPPKPQSKPRVKGSIKAAGRLLILLLAHKVINCAVNWSAKKTRQECERDLKERNSSCARKGDSRNRRCHQWG